MSLPPAFARDRFLAPLSTFAAFMSLLALLSALLIVLLGEPVAVLLALVFSLSGIFWFLVIKHVSLRNLRDYLHVSTTGGWIALLGLMANMVSFALVVRLAERAVYAVVMLVVRRDEIMLLEHPLDVFVLFGCYWLLVVASALPLIGTVATFGWPLHVVRKHAATRLVGSERGERLVAWFASVYSALALFAVMSIPRGIYRGCGYPEDCHITADEITTTTVFGVSVTLGALALGSCMLLRIAARERARRTFIAKVEAGAVSTLRIRKELGPAGSETRWLVRIADRVGHYREAPVQEDTDILALDDVMLTTK